MILLIKVGIHESCAGVIEIDGDTGKKQLTQLMTFLDNKGGSLKEGVTGGKSDSAIKTVRAKREADEAGMFSTGEKGMYAHFPSVDKEYRKGVHHFETLRLRRHKILEGAFKARRINFQYIHYAANFYLRVSSFS